MCCIFSSSIRSLGFFACTPLLCAHSRLQSKHRHAAAYLQTVRSGHRRRQKAQKVNPIMKPCQAPEAQAPAQSHRTSHRHSPLKPSNMGPLASHNAVPRAPWGICRSPLVLVPAMLHCRSLHGQLKIELRPRYRAYRAASDSVVAASRQIGPSYPCSSLPPTTRTTQS